MVYDLDGWFFWFFFVGVGICIIGVEIFVWLLFGFGVVYVMVYDFFNIFERSELFEEDCDKFNEEV